jgi:hypothetical protein
MLHVKGGERALELSEANWVVSCDAHFSFDGSGLTPLNCCHRRREEMKRELE